MTDIVDVPAAPVVPPFPALGSNNFNDETYAAGSALPGLSAGIHAIGVATKTNALAAKEAAAAAVPAANAAVEARNAAVPAAEAAVAARNAAVPAADAAVDAAQRAEQAAASIQDGPVVSVGGATGVVPLKTLNGLPLVGNGNIQIDAGASIYRVERISPAQIAPADKGKLIDITAGTFTQTFAAEDELGDGWFCYLRNAGTGDITIPSSDGAINWIIYPGEVRLFQCDGVALHTMVLRSFNKVFTASGNFIKPPGYAEVEGLLWAGGSSGSRYNGSTVSGGRGGACTPIRLRCEVLGLTTPVVIGSGGAPQTTVGDGNAVNAGGDSSFAGIVSNGGGNGALAGNAFGPYIFESNGTIFKSGPNTLYGGCNAHYSATSSAVYGGGAGQWIFDGSPVAYARTTVVGGLGGNASVMSGVPGQDGKAPGGGGGAANQANSGAGARGELRIWGVI